MTTSEQARILAQAKGLAREYRPFPSQPREQTTPPNALPPNVHGGHDHAREDDAD